MDDGVELLCVHTFHHNITSVQLDAGTRVERFTMLKCFEKVTMDFVEWRCGENRSLITEILFEHDGTEPFPPFFLFMCLYLCVCVKKRGGTR